MAKVAITEQYLEDIADAIRAKTGSSDVYYPSEMADAISHISGGGGIIPSGTINITENGTHNVYNYASANVSVASTINNQNKVVTPSASQQTVTADAGYTGLGTVTVNGDSDLVAGNIKKNVQIFGVTGTYEGGGSTPVIDSLTVTPSASQQIFNSASVDGYKPVTVNGDSNLIAGNIKNGVSIFGVTGNYSGGTVTIDSLSVTPSETEQTFNSSSVDGYKPVTVSAISSTYVGSGITRRSSTDLSASGATVTVPAGYYASQASKAVSTMTLPTSASTSATAGYTSKADISAVSGAYRYINIPPGYNSTGSYYRINALLLEQPTFTSNGIYYASDWDSHGFDQVTVAIPNGSATGPSSLSGTSATVSTGTNTLTLTKTGVTTTPTVSAGYISSATASTATVSLTASVTTKAAATITPGTTNQTIASGTYLTGTQTIAGDADLVASNIVNGVQIFGVTGNVVLQNYYTGSSAPSSSTGSNGDLYLQS